MPLGRHFLRKLDLIGVPDLCIVVGSNSFDQTVGRMNSALQKGKKKPLRTGAFDVTAAW